MVIKNLLEYHCVMWKQRCDIIAKENDLSYEGRQRKDIYSLCLYLKSHPDELLSQDMHYTNRDENFFSKSPLDNVLMWKSCIENVGSKKTFAIKNYDGSNMTMTARQHGIV